MASVPRGRALPYALMLWAAASTFGCASTRDQRGGYLEVIRADQRPPLVGARAAADSLFGALEECERGDGIAEPRRAELEAMVRRFAPTLVLPSGDDIGIRGGRAQLLPIDPALFADTLRLDRVRAAPYQLKDFQDISLRGLGLDSLSRLVDLGLRSQSDPELLEVWYFDFPGTRPREWWEAYARLRMGPDSAAWSRPTVFAHPFVDERNRVVIQYWYFYPMNDYITNHEGDWEHVNVALSSDRSAIEEVHYFFHARSVTLPQGKHRPEIVDETHPVVHVGGRAYTVLDYPNRLISHDRNSGSHGNYPYSGEWEAVAGLGHTESVSGPGRSPTRTIAHSRFQVVLTPEPSRIDYRRHPEILREWAWLLLPVRWGFPSAPSMGSRMLAADVGNRAPFGPAFNAGWNRTGPGLTYPGYRIRRIPALRSYLEDLLQPWYYLYAFRHPRFVHDTRGTLPRRDLERLGFVPRSGWAERGVGSTLLGLSLGYPREGFKSLYGSSTGISLWRDLWAKVRFGGIEFVGGYQRFPRTEGVGGSLFVYPITANFVLRGPEALLRPYATAGAGPSGWESRLRLPNTSAQLISSGWGVGWSAGAGVEYYLRQRVAFDVAVRYQDCPGPGDAGLGDERLRFVTVWIGHYLRF